MMTPDSGINVLAHGFQHQIEHVLARKQIHFPTFEPLLPAPETIPYFEICCMLRHQSAYTQNR